MPQLVVNMHITLLNLIYLYTEKLEIIKRHAAYFNRYLQAKKKRTKEKIRLMKKIFLLIVSFIFLNQITTIAQEIAVSSTFSHSSYDKFQNNIGYEIGYNQYINSNNRLGFTFSHSFYNTDYNYIFMSDADGIDYYREVKPENQKMTFSINYGFNILNKKRSNFYIGPKLGLSYFKVNEIGTERPTNENDDYEYKCNYWDNNKIGIGLLLEYDRKIISDNISVFFSTEPEITFYSRFGLMGSSAPVMIGLINLNIGLKINLNNHKEIE